MLNFFCMNFFLTHQENGRHIVLQPETSEGNNCMNSLNPQQLTTDPQLTTNITSNKSKEKKTSQNKNLHQNGCVFRPVFSKKKYMLSNCQLFTVKGPPPVKNQSHNIPTRPRPIMADSHVSSLSIVPTSGASNCETSCF